MIIPIDYNTSIDELLTHSSSKTIFLSSWNRRINKDDIPFNLIEKSIAVSENEINKYNYMDELDDIKNFISSTISKNEGTSVSKDELAVGINGTSSAYLIFKAISNNIMLRPLILSPVYFSYILALNDFCSEIEYHQIRKDNELIIVIF